jgi:hypothetical protein
MDPDSTFKIKLRTASPGCKKDACPYTFIKCIDKDTTNYKYFVDEYAKEYPWGLNETLHLSYLDDTLKSYVDVRSDQDMMAMFGRFESSKYIEIKANIVPCTTDQTMIDNTENAPQPPSPSSTKPVLLQTTYLSNPFPMFEHVGVDEEGMYGVEIVHVHIPSVGMVDKEHINVDNDKSENEESSEKEESSEDEGSSEKEESSEDVGSSEKEEINERTTTVVEMVEDWVVQDVILDFTPLVVYDKEDPPMTVGSIYSSIAEFKVALSQHAIKNEREFDREKNDPDRVRVHCSNKFKGCKWRVHASTLQDKVIVQASSINFATVQFFYFYTLIIFCSILCRSK